MRLMKTLSEIEDAIIDLQRRANDVLNCLSDGETEPSDQTINAQSLVDDLDHAGHSIRILIQSI